MGSVYCDQSQRAAHEPSAGNRAMLAPFAPSRGLTGLPVAVSRTSTLPPFPLLSQRKTSRPPGLYSSTRDSQAFFVRSEVGVGKPAPGCLANTGVRSQVQCVSAQHVSKIFPSAENRGV